ncbi:MAG: T9SS type A sorting domain-containing protein [Saprospiraceae bacterium]|nr:T9SS type A sorting domain-containing protein [Saprospiraceae bacterium]
MKQSLLLTFIWICCCGSLAAQISISNDYFPASGDTTYTAIDNLPTGIEVGSTGPNQSWNFTSLQAPFSRRTIYRNSSSGNFFNEYPSSDLLAELVENAESYYNVTSSRFELQGFGGSDPVGLGVEALPKYSPPLVERWAPLEYEDENSSEANISYAFSADDLPDEITDPLPITPDSFRVRYSLSRVDVVDAWGTMTIPGGAYEVLREKRTTMQDVRLDAKVGFFGWQDITDIVLEAIDIDEILGMDNALGESTTIAYHFYSDEAKEPIAIVTMDEEGVNPVRVQFKGNDIISNVQNVNALRPGVYAFPNPAIVNVRFEFSNLKPGNYTLRIYNILGVEVWKKKYNVNNFRTEKVDISTLRKGTYLYSLSNEKGKTLATKRLIIIRP